MLFLRPMPSSTTGADEPAIDMELLSRVETPKRTPDKLSMTEVVRDCSALLTYQDK